MQEVIARNGKTNPVVEYIARQDGHWIAVPATSGSLLQVPCSRLDLLKKHAGIDLVVMYPPDGPTNDELAKTWTLDTFLAAAERCAKGGYPLRHRPRYHQRFGRLCWRDLSDPLAHNSSKRMARSPSSRKRPWEHSIT